MIISIIITKRHDVQIIVLIKAHLSADTYNHLKQTLQNEFIRRNGQAADAITVFITDRYIFLITRWLKL